MARVGNFREKKNLVSHLTHEHLLKEVEGNGEEFMCKGCSTVGEGVRYICTKNCDFSLHEICTIAETFISSHIHVHELELNWEGICQDPYGKNIHGNHHRCNVCEEEVVGLYYTCAQCDDFYIHPVCSKFPARLRHVIDTKHDLTFQCITVNPVSPRFCSICHDVCSSPWRYRCGPCGYDIHLECVIRPLSPPTSLPPPPQPDFLCRSASMPIQSPPVTHQQKSMVEKQKSAIYYHHQDYFPNHHANYVAIGVPLAQPYHHGLQMQAPDPYNGYQHSQHPITSPTPFEMYQQHQQQPSFQHDTYQKHQQQPPTLHNPLFGMYQTPHSALGMPEYQQQPIFIDNQMYFLPKHQQEPYMKPDPIYDMSKHQQQQFIEPDPKIQESTGTVSSELPSSSSSGNENKRFKKRKIFWIVARIGITVASGVAFGLPIPI